jgi:DNA-binding MarR family transcriptional regulator
MKEKSLLILKLLCFKDAISKVELKQRLDIKDWQLAEYIRDLEKKGFLTNNTDHIRIQINAKTNFIKRVEKKYDLVKLLRNNNDKILKEIIKHRDVGDHCDVESIMDHTKLSKATVYRALAYFEEVGVIQRQIAFSDEFFFLDQLAEKIPD